MGEEKDVGNRVFINKVVGNNDNKEEHIDDSKGDETLKVIFPFNFTLCFLFRKYVITKLHASGFNPYECNLAISRP